MRPIHFAALVAAFLVGCGAGDDDPLPPDPPPDPPLPLEAVTVVKIAGDGQTVEQHAFLSNALEVRVTDRQGVGLPGYVVSFTAAPGSGGFAEETTATGFDGVAFFRTFFHDAGDQEVLATAGGGYRPAVFVIHVTPRGSDIDGVYSIAYSGILRDPDRDPTVEIPVTGAVAIAIDNGELADPNTSQLTTWIVSGSFSSTDGSLDVTMRMSPDIWDRFTGTLSLDGNTPGGSGTWIELWRGSAVADTGGPWTATKR